MDNELLATMVQFSTLFILSSSDSSVLSHFFDIDKILNVFDGTEFDNVSIFFLKDWIGIHWVFGSDTVEFVVIVVCIDIGDIIRDVRSPKEIK